MRTTVRAEEHALYRVLVLAPEAAGAPNLGHLSGGTELSDLAEIAGLHVDSLIGAVTEQELSDALLEGGYGVLHVAAHGDGEGIALSDCYLDGAQLGRFLTMHDVRLALLLSCQSDGFAQAVAAAGCDFVVATSCAISNEVARKFGREFYRFLVRTQSAVRAFAYAQSRLSEADAGGFVPVEAPDGTPAHLIRLMGGVEVHLHQVDADAMAWRVEVAGLLKQMETHLMAKQRETVQAVLQLARVLSHD